MVSASLLLVSQLAAGTGSFSLVRSSIGGGGGDSSGGDFEIASAIGQVNAGMMEGGIYSVETGFLGGSPDYAGNRFVFLPVIISGSE